MPDISIRRKHRLGLKAARDVAGKWAEEAQAKFDMDCTYEKGAERDVVRFKRSGVSGELVVAADHFDLGAQLGVLLGAFKAAIEAEIQKHLNQLLAQSEKRKGGTEGVKQAVRKRKA